MGQYFFHLCTPEGRSVDDVGCAFADVEAAFLDTHRAIIEISAEMLAKRQDPARCAFEICDANGEVLVVVPFDEVLRPKAKPVHDFEVLRRRVAQNIARGQGLKADLDAGLNEVKRNLEALRAAVRQL